MDTGLISMIGYLRGRIEVLEWFIAQGVVPGQLDTMELEQMRGGVLQLKKALAVAEDIKTSNQL